MLLRELFFSFRAILRPQPSLRWVAETFTGVLGEECKEFLCVPQVQLFSEPGFQGCNVVLEDSATSLQDGFCVASCKVLSGRYGSTLKTAAELIVTSVIPNI